MNRLIVSSFGLGIVAAVWVGCSGSSTSDSAFGGSGGTSGSSTGTASTAASMTTGTASTGTSTTGSTTSTTSTSGTASTTGSGGNGVGGNGSGGNSTTGASGSGGSDLDGGMMDAPSDGPQAIAEVFGNSPGTLYKLDPNTKQMTTVGNFSGCNGDVIDIALDKNGAMWGTTFGGLFKIDKTTAACTLVAAGSYPNSLSFVPAGTVDPLVEALVGYNGATYVRMDLATGVITTIGSLGNNPYSSSGDIVSVIGAGTYLTVNGGNCSDCIIEVDPKTGAMLNLIGSVAHSSVYGLAYWGGVAYGFDAAGELFQINLQSAATTNIPIPNAPPGLIFYGAGSSTAAPHS